MSGDRRRLGLLVVVASVVLAVLAPQATRPVAGTPQAAVIPGPPAVGDCLLERISLRNGYEATTGFTVPAARMQSCTGARFGEVVAVAEARGVTRPQRLERCGQAARAYLGVNPAEPSAPALPAQTAPSAQTAQPEQPVADPWAPSVRAGLVLAGPDSLQRAAGQDWVACVVDVTVPGGGGPGDAPETYPGSARGGYDGGRLPSAFALCRSGRDVIDAADIPCTQGHPVEVLASTYDVPVAAAVTLQDTCDALAARLTRMPDPTAGGRLEVVVSSGHVAPDGTVRAGADADGHVSLAQCLVGVVGPGALTGTLIGLGAAPVPWAD